jgi:hypothetical protein
LAPNLSFDNDSSANFPITSPDPQNASITKDRPTLIFYRGYIPTLAIFDGKGRTVYDPAGETAGRRGDTRGLDALIQSALDPPSSVR